ncbi:hypothetical protein Tco_1506030 [Tanacetum coccineum]
MGKKVRRQLLFGMGYDYKAARRKKEQGKKEGLFLLRSFAGIFSDASKKGLLDSCSLDWVDFIGLVIIAQIRHAYCMGKTCKSKENDQDSLRDPQKSDDEKESIHSVRFTKENNRRSMVRTIAETSPGSLRGQLFRRQLLSARSGVYSVMSMHDSIYVCAFFYSAMPSGAGEIDPSVWLGWLFLSEFKDFIVLHSRLFISVFASGNRRQRRSSYQMGSPFHVSFLENRRKGKGFTEKKLGGNRPPLNSPWRWPQARNTEPWDDECGKGNKENSSTKNSHGRVTIGIDYFNAYELYMSRDKLVMSFAYNNRCMLSLSASLMCSMMDFKFDFKTFLLPVVAELTIGSEIAVNDNLCFNDLPLVMGRMASHPRCEAPAIDFFLVLVVRGIGGLERMYLRDVPAFGGSSLFFLSRSTEASDCSVFFCNVSVNLRISYETVDDCVSPIVGLGAAAYESECLLTVGDGLFWEDLGSCRVVEELVSSRIRMSCFWRRKLFTKPVTFEESVEGFFLAYGEYFVGLWYISLKFGALFVDLIYIQDTVNEMTVVWLFLCPSHVGLVWFGGSDGGVFVDAALRPRGHY